MDICKFHIFELAAQLLFFRQVSLPCKSPEEVHHIENNHRRSDNRRPTMKSYWIHSQIWQIGSNRIIELIQADLQPSFMDVDRQSRDQNQFVVWGAAFQPEPFDLQKHQVSQSQADTGLRQERMIYLLPSFVGTKKFGSKRGRPQLRSETKGCTIQQPSKQHLPDPPAIKIALLQLDSTTQSHSNSSLP